MKIVADIRLLARGGQSGVEEYTRQMMTHLINREDFHHDWHLFYNGIKTLPITTTLPSIRNGIPIINWHVSNKLLNFCGRFFHAPAIDDCCDADLIYSPHFNLLCSRSIPRIVTIHDLSFIHHPHFFSRKHRLWHWMQDCRRQLREARHIIAISESTRSDIIETFDVPDNHISVIYPGINPSFHSPSSHPRPHTKPYLLYLGTIEPRKNIELIIHAFNLLKQDSTFDQLQLICAGGLGWLYNDIIQLYRSSPVARDIHFIQPITDAHRVALYQNAEVFLFPSFFEGFGLPPLEAQSCGCPVIVSDRTSLPEILGNSALFVNPWSVEEMFSQIRKILTDSAVKWDLITRGLNNVKRFNWNVSADALLKEIDRLS